MKTVGKMVLTLVALVSVAATASAATDKLIVNNGSGTPVFKVDDTGLLTGPNYYFDAANKKFGFGTSTPKTSLHLVELTSPFDRGLTIGQHDGSTAAAVINIKKSSGTDASPGLPVSGANVAAFHAQVYDGNTNIANANGYSANASFFFFLEPGTYSAANVPTAIRFETGVSQATRKERVRIGSDGRIRISNQPSAPANNATCTVGDLILDAAGGYLYLCTATDTWKRTSFVSY